MKILIMILSIQQKIKLLKLYTKINMENLNDFVLQTIADNISLEQVYENLFNKMYNINESRINEGFFNTVSKLLKKSADKIDKFDNDIDTAKIKLSNAATTAIANAKQKAGNTWDSIKQTYEKVVGVIDNALQQAKGSVTDAVKKTNITADEIEAKLGNIYTNGLAQGKAVFINFLTNKTKIHAINTLMIGAIMCNKAGLNSSQIIDILDAAGIK